MYGAPPSVRWPTRFNNSDRVTAHDYSADSNWVAERTRVFNSRLILGRPGEHLRNLMLFNVLDSSKHVLELVGCLKLHSVFPQAHWARKSTWFGTKSLQSLTGRISRNFRIFQNSHDNTQEARVCARSAVSSPKLTSRS